jgi:hypothetical protein
MTKIKEIISPVTGRIWMDRNIGAKKKAKNRLDNPKTYGEKFTYEKAKRIASKYKELGYRLPTKEELEAEGKDIQHNLKLPKAGIGSWLTSTDNYHCGSYGHYWSITEKDDKAKALHFSNSIAYVYKYDKMNNYSIRLIKDK